MAVKTSVSATATVKLVGATEEFSDSESEEEQMKEDAVTHENRKTVDSPNIPEVAGKQNTGNNPQSYQERKTDIEDPGGTKIPGTIVSSGSPRKERFNPFNKESFEDDKLPFSQLTPSNAQDSPESKHSGTCFPGMLYNGKKTEEIHVIRK